MWKCNCSIVRELWENWCVRLGSLWGVGVTSGWMWGINDGARVVIVRLLMVGWDLLVEGRA